MKKKETKISISPIALKRLEFYYHNTKIEEIYFGVNEIKTEGYRISYMGKY